MGSKKTTTQTTSGTQTAAPPTWALPGMESVANLITQAIPQVAAVPAYSGGFVAQPGQMALDAPGMYQQAAQTASSLVNPAMQALQAAGQMPQFSIPDLTAPQQGFAAGNPGGMDAAIAAAVRPTTQNLMETVLPSLQSAGIESGAYGGSRALTALPSLAIRDAASHAQDIASQMRYQDYTDTAARQLQAYGLDTQRGLGVADTLTSRLGLTPELLDSIMRMSGGAAELTAAGGQLQGQNSQAAIDDAMARYQYQVQQPFMGLDTATSLLHNLAAGYGTTTSNGNSTTVEKTGGLAPVLGAALGAASMVGSFAMPGGGSLGGSLVSSLFGKKA